MQAAGATTNIGLKIGANWPGAGANNWAIYSESQAQSYFAGNVGIGTTNPLGTLAVFSTTDVPFRVNGDGVRRFATDDDTNNLYAFGDWQTSWSDRNLKHDIKPQSNMLNKIMQTNPVTYKWNQTEKLGNKMHYGIIAQEIQKIFPTLVYEDEDGHLNVKRDEIQFILMQAVKEIVNRLNITNAPTSTPSIYINPDGNVGIGIANPSTILAVVQNSATDPIADAWTTYSSRRWKTNIQPITGALDKVNALEGVYFDWKADGKHDLGMIAEDVGKVIPEVVAYEENGADAKSLDYARLTAVLVEAVKEQQREIEILKREVAELKGDL